MRNSACTIDSVRKETLVICILGLPWWLRKKKICLQCMRPGFDPWVRKINFCLENPMDRGVWQATVHGVTKSD